MQWGPAALPVRMEGFQDTRAGWVSSGSQRGCVSELRPEVSGQVVREEGDLLLRRFLTASGPRDV